MSQLSRLFIPSIKIWEAETEVEKLGIVTHELTCARIDPTSLVYAGVEGTPLLEDATWPHHDKTFGYSYDDACSLADAIDRFGSAGESYTIIKYALEPEVILPAIVTYTASELQSSDEEDEAWLPHPGRTLQEAARAVIFLTDGLKGE
jgi:hypothetical protein